MKYRLTDRLAEALCIAERSHKNQTHAGGSPYILHVMRVVERVWRDGADETTLIVAALHDVIEDDPTVSFGALVKLFGSEVGAALNAITHRPGEPYMRYIQRVQQNPIAKAVKLADLEDNRTACILYPLQDQSQQRLTAKYDAAWEVLTSTNVSA